MKLYSQVFVAAESKKETDYYMDKEGDLFALKEVGEAIVCTEEDLWKIWCKCALSQVDPETMATNEANFKAYFKSEGIIL